MKRSILLFTAVTGIFYLTLTSYQTGPGVTLSASDSPNRTGSTTGALNNCSSPIGCHGAIDQVTGISLTLTDANTNHHTSAGRFIAGQQYNGVLTLSNTNNNPAKYGFQLTTVRGLDQQAGVLAPGNNQHTFTVGSGSTQITGIEHSNPLVAVNPGGILGIPFTWTAPADTAPVKFYIIVNAVNGDGVPGSDDHATTKIITLNSQLASVSELSEHIRITAYPNPATERVSLKFEDAEKGSSNVKVIDITGRMVYSTNLMVSGSMTSTTIETGNWAKGLYFAQIVKDGAQRMIAVAKQ